MAIEQSDLYFRCKGVPDDILLPEKQWTDAHGFQRTLEHLGSLFKRNFKSYEDGGGFVSIEMAARIATGGPRMA